MRLIFFAILALAASSLPAVLITEYRTDERLRPYETVRYRLDVDYGFARTAELVITVRGFLTPPRVRVLDSRKREVKDVRDKDGDWKLDFNQELHDGHLVYFVEVDSAWPGDHSDFEVRLMLLSAEGSDAWGEFRTDKYYIDHESGSDSDHYDCTARPVGFSWALAPLGVLALLAAIRRRGARA